jgi:2-phosphoglycerate kinase
VDATTPGRPWDVLLIGGASGVGKTTVAGRLARDLGVGVAEVDDLHTAVTTMTTPEQQPLLHHWQTSPAAASMSAEEIVDLHVSVSRLLVPVVRTVCEQHAEDGSPVILEGDYLVPEIMDPRQGWKAGTLERVRAVFLYEPDVDQVVSNLYRREPHAGDQSGRARVTQMFGHWLREECRHRPAASIEVRPLATAPERILAALDRPAD